MKRYILLITAALCLAACSDDKYVASVDDLRLVRIEPASGYSGSIAEILGRNFSSSFGENRVTIGGKDAKIIEFNKDQLTVIIPENELGTYDVVVTTPLGEISREDVTFTYKKRPEKLYTVTTIAGNGSNTLKDEIGTSAALGQIEGLAWAPDGNLWFCQRSAGNAIRSYNLSTSMVKTIASPIPLPWGGDFDAAGDFYFAAKDAKVVKKVAQDGTVSDYACDAALNAPMYVQFDSQDNMWIASRGNNTVYKVKNGATLETYTGEKYFPASLAIDAKDRVFFGSTQLRGIFMIADGQVTRVIGSGTKPTKENYEESLASGNPLDVHLGYVGGIYIGKDGTLWYTDYLTFTVMKVVPDENGDYANGTISLVAGIPFSNAIVNGTTDKAAFKYPSGIAVSDDGKKVYVSEPTGYVLRVIDLN